MQSHVQGLKAGRFQYRVELDVVSTMSSSAGRRISARATPSRAVGPAGGFVARHGKAVQVEHIRLTLGVESTWLSTI